QTTTTSRLSEVDPLLPPMATLVLAEVRGQRSEVSPGATEKRRWVLNHRAEHSSDFGTASRKILVFIERKIVAVFREVERGIGLAVFAIAVRQPGNEMGRVATFSPSFAKTHAHGSRGSPDLAGQGVSFLSGETLGHSKGEHRQVVGLPINVQVFCRSDEHDKSPSALHHGPRCPIHRLSGHNPRPLTSDF